MDAEMLGSSRTPPAALAQEIGKITNEQMARLEQRLGLLLLNEMCGLLRSLSALDDRDRLAALYVFGGAVKPLIADFSTACDQVRDKMKGVIE